MILKRQTDRLEIPQMNDPATWVRVVLRSYLVILKWQTDRLPFQHSSRVFIVLTVVVPYMWKYLLI